MHFDISIGIVTYLGRYESYFIPLIQKLYRIFPDCQIIVYINGHYDKLKQFNYLHKITFLLRKFSNISYIINLDHQPLARGWNWIIIMSKCEHILILNDDVNVNYEFRYNLWKFKNKPEIFLINGSWSHFIISKKTIKDVGWFDERFAGIGCEDHDYTFRLAMKGIAVLTIPIHGIYNQIAPQTDAGWSNITEIDGEIGRHSQVNRDFLKKKWFWSQYEEVPESGATKVWYPAYKQEWVVAPKEGIKDMPDFYPLTCLDNSDSYKPDAKQISLAFFSHLISFINSLFWKIRLFLRIRNRLPWLFR